MPANGNDFYLEETMKRLAWFANREKTFGEGDIVYIPFGSYGSSKCKVVKITKSRVRLNRLTGQGGGMWRKHHECYTDAVDARRAARNACVS